MCIRDSSTTDNQIIKAENQIINQDNLSHTKSTISLVKKYLWLSISAILAILVGLLGFKDELFSKKFYYSFIDADRNSKINAELQVQILKENESPILYVAKPNEPFVLSLIHISPQRTGKHTSRRHPLANIGVALVVAITQMDATVLQAREIANLADAAACICLLYTSRCV